MIVQKTLLDFPAARETLAIMQGQAEGSKQIRCSVYSINQPSRLCSMRRCPRCRRRQLVLRFSHLIQVIRMRVAGPAVSSRSKVKHLTDSEH
jgi:hypothetical protein